MTTVEITPAEVASRMMTPEHLQTAVDAVLRDGFVVLKDVIEAAHLDALLERTLEDLA